MSSSSSSSSSLSSSWQRPTWPIASQEEGHNCDAFQSSRRFHESDRMFLFLSFFLWNRYRLHGVTFTPIMQMSGSLTCCCCCYQFRGPFHPFRHRFAPALVFLSLPFLLCLCLHPLPSSFFQSFLSNCQRFLAPSQFHLHSSSVSASVAVFGVSASFSQHGASEEERISPSCVKTLPRTNYGKMLINE